MTQHLEDLLTRAVRERAYAYASLAEARAEMDTLRGELCATRLDLNLAHELLAYHDIQPIQEAS